MTLEYLKEQLAKFQAIDPEAVLQAAKDDESNEYPYITAFVKLKWEWQTIVRMLSSAVEQAEELDALQWAAEKVLDDSRIEAPTDKESVWEGVLYPAANVIKDLRQRGWSNDKIRRHEITDLEVEQEKHITPQDLCLECRDEDTYVGPGKHFCSYCEDELVEIATYEHQSTTP